MCGLICGELYRCKVDTILLCVSSTPLGNPVVPLEYGRKAMSLDRALGKTLSVSPLHVPSKLITPDGIALFSWNNLFYVCARFIFVEIKLYRGFYNNN